MDFASLEPLRLIEALAWIERSYFWNTLAHEEVIVSSWAFYQQRIKKDFSETRKRSRGGTTCCAAAGFVCVTAEMWYPAETYSNRCRGDGALVICSLSTAASRHCIYILSAYKGGTDPCASVTSAHRSDIFHAGGKLIRGPLLGWQSQWKHSYWGCVIDCSPPLSWEQRIPDTYRRQIWTENMHSFLISSYGASQTPPASPASHLWASTSCWITSCIHAALNQTNSWISNIPKLELF